MTFAAYPDTSAAVRSLGDFIKNAPPMGGDGGEDVPLDFRAIEEEDNLFGKIYDLEEVETDE